MEGLFDLSIWSDPTVYVSLLTLTFMEIVLGIDNIVFITILCGKLPEHLEKKARRAGIAVALVSRIALLFALNWVMQLTKPFIEAGTIPFVDHAFSGRDLILLGGGIFLIGKATHEIYENVEHPEVDSAEEEMIAGNEPDAEKENVGKLLTSIMIQVLLLDVVFSLDSVITAVGMAKHLPVMALAMILAVIVMLIFAGPVGDFVQKNPSVRILALAFLVLIGVMLTVEGMGGHVSKGYIYSAIGFSLVVEMVNLRRHKKETQIVDRDADPRDREIGSG